MTQVKDLIKHSIWKPSKNYNTATPKISVLMPTYCRYKSGWFKKALDSIINQTFKDFELIIIDDCSTDGTNDLIKLYMKKDPRISCIRHTKNIGLPAVSMIEAFKKSKAPYHIFASDDSILFPDALKKLFNAAKSTGEKVICGQVKLHNVLLGTHLDTNIFFTNMIPNTGVLLHKDVIKSIGYYDPHILLTRICDWDLWRRIYKKYNFYIINAKIAEEFGYKLKTSLGNTRRLSIKSCEELLYTDRTALLQYDNILDYNVISPDLCFNLSEPTRQKMIHEYNITHETKLPKEHRKIKIRKKIYFISTSTPEITAQLTFGDLLFNTNSKSYLFIYKHISQLHEIDYQNVASIIINARNINIKIIKLFFKLLCLFKIKTFWYIDDVFNLIEEEHLPLHLNPWRNLKNTHSLFRSASGSITSTKKIKQYFIKNKLSKICYVMPPIKPANIKKVKPHKINSKHIHIACISSYGKHKVFLDNILPALIRLSKEFLITLHILENYRTKSIISNMNKESSLKVIYHPLCLDYNKFIEEIMKYTISFVIHPSVKTKNNKFKTNNILISSDLLNAVAIVNKKAPFLNIFKHKVCMFSENTPQSYYRTIKKLITDKELCKNILLNNKNYCSKEFSGAKNIEAIELLSEEPANHYFAEKILPIIFKILCKLLRVYHNVMNSYKRFLFVKQQYGNIFGIFKRILEKYLN